MQPGYTGKDLCRLLQLPMPSMRQCLRAALLPAPAAKQSYNLQDVILLRTCHSLIEACIPVGRIRRLLQSLKDQMPSDRHLSSVRIYASGKRIVVWDGMARWQPDSGQFLFNFDAGDFSGQVRTPKAFNRRKRRTVADWCGLGDTLREESPNEATKAYEQAIEVDPTYGPAHLGLGEVLMGAEEWDRAERSFRRACECLPGNPYASYHWATALEKLNRADDAIAAYHESLARDDKFFEAHYRLALLYEVLDRPVDAIRHLQAARRLTRKQ